MLFRYTNVNNEGVVIFNKVHRFCKTNGSWYFCLGKSRDLGTKLLFLRFVSGKYFYWVHSSQYYFPVFPLRKYLCLGPRVSFGSQSRANEPSFITLSLFLFTLEHCFKFFLPPLPHFGSFVFVEFGSVRVSSIARDSLSKAYLFGEYFLVEGPAVPRGVVVDCRS